MIDDDEPLARQIEEELYNQLNNNWKRLLKKAVKHLFNRF